MHEMTATLLTLIAALMAPPATQTPMDDAAAGAVPRTDVLYAGYQDLRGQTEVPVFGLIDTRSRTWFIARWTEKDGAWVLQQRTCAVDFDRVLGARVNMPEQLMRRLPVTEIPFRPEAGGLFAPAWTSGWGADDLDGDGHPGATIEVDAPVCSGGVYVASTATSSARLRPDGDGFQGKIRVRVRQQVLGASGACLRTVAQDSDETMRGVMRVVPVGADASCSRWSLARWPARLSGPGREPG